MTWELGMGIQALQATADPCSNPARLVAYCPRVVLACTVQSLADIARRPGLYAGLVLLSARSPGSSRPRGGTSWQCLVSCLMGWTHLWAAARPHG
eukprot:8888990-Lingulodinium_polyedra.AAC.1